jgi:hypothetical protein
MIRAATENVDRIAFSLLLGARVLRELEVLDPTAEHSFLGEFLDEDNLGRNKKAERPWVVGSSDFNARILEETLGAFEAKAAARDVFALNHTFLISSISDASRVVHSDAGMLAPVL